MTFFKDQLKNVEAFIFDVDGVLAGESSLITADGDLLRTTNLKDGFAMNVAINLGFKIAIITGGYNEGVRIRYEKLGVHKVYMGVGNKLQSFEKFIAKYELLPENILYMGDDVPDLSVMKEVGVPTCPKDAAEEIKAISSYVSNKKGGEGAVRDVVEQTLRVQNKWVGAKNFVW